MSKKNAMTEFLLCLFLGVFGAHKFYVGKIGMGILYLFTAGLFGIGWLVDTIVLLMHVIKKDEEKNIQQEKSFQNFNVAGANYYQHELNKIAKIIKSQIPPDAMWRGKSDDQIRSSKSDKPFYELPILPQTGDIVLAREPDNPHDKNAVRVDLFGIKVGYVPAEINTVVWKSYQSSNNLQWILFGGRYKEFDGEEVIVRSMPYKVEIGIAA